MFVRLECYAVSFLHRTEAEFWAMPFGKLLDQIDAWKILSGHAKAYKEANIDDVIPFGM